MTSPCCEAYVTAPIKLAAEINEHGERRRRRAQWTLNDESPSVSKSMGGHSRVMMMMMMSDERASQTNKQITRRKDYQTRSTRTRSNARALQLLAPIGALAILAVLIHQTSALLQHAHNSQLINSQDQAASAQSALSSEQQQLRHQTHYMDFVPSARFSYIEGRQMGARSLQDTSSDDSMAAAAAAAAPTAATSSHIYKRSSAVLMPPVAAQISSARAALEPLRHRMMSEGERVQHKHHHQQQQQQQTPARQSNWLGVAPGGDHLAEVSAQSEPTAEEQQTPLVSVRDQQDSMQQSQRLAPGSGSQVSLAGNQRKQVEREAELLRQKQHIQYHDQWPSMAGKCHKRTLNFCASVLPFNTTTFPNIIGDTNRFEVKRSLPFFGFLAKSSCNKRLDELLCLLLEPPCQPVSGAAIPPCKKFCRLALEGCNEYIPATLALSSVFDCRQYPDSTDPSVCVNLAQGSKCAADEFKCPDKTCIPRNWLCDGVRDCVFAADEANCTVSAASPQASVCSTEEFKCDGKCVPKAWKCDGERDCLDGSDEESCDARPRCGPDRFKCHDGNGCIPKRWVCDGKAECRDGSDEMNCEQRDCSESDFKCDNGICIPKLWRCDRQFDCKDGSDERQCIYPTPSTSTTTTTTTTTTTASPAELTSTDGEITTTTGGEIFLNASSSYSVNHQADSNSQVATTSEEQESTGATPGEHEPASSAKQQLEMSLNGDISRIIQHESLASSSPTPSLSLSSSLSSPSSSSSSSSSSSPSPSPPATPAADQNQMMQTTHIAGSQEEITPASQAIKELKKFDYDLIPSSSSSNELTVNQQPQAQKMMTQIDFVQHQQQGAPVVVVVDNNIQQQAQVRGLKFVGAQQAPTMMQETRPVDHLQQQPQQPPHHRVPIYRGLFKSFKGHHHHGANQHQRALYRQQVELRNGTHRNVVAIARRRRDRHQPSSAQQMVLASSNPMVAKMEQKQDSAGAGQLVEIAQPPALQMMQIPHQQQHLLKTHEQHQRARAILPPHHHQQSHHQSSPLSSYLNLLNGRYNLRHPRDVSEEAAAAAS